MYLLYIINLRIMNQYQYLYIHVFNVAFFIPPTNHEHLWILHPSWAVGSEVAFTKCTEGWSCDESWLAYHLMRTLVVPPEIFSRVESKKYGLQKQKMLKMLMMFFVCSCSVFFLTPFFAKVSGHDLPLRWRFVSTRPPYDVTVWDNFPQMLELFGAALQCSCPLQDFNIKTGHIFLLGEKHPLDVSCAVISENHESSSMFGWFDLWGPSSLYKLQQLQGGHRHCLRLGVLHLQSGNDLIASQRKPDPPSDKARTKSETFSQDSNEIIQWIVNTEYATCTYLINISNASFCAFMATNYCTLTLCCVLHVFTPAICTVCRSRPAWCN